MRTNKLKVSWRFNLKHWLLIYLKYFLHDSVVMKPPRHNAELGLAYVGISRVTDIEDLTLLSAVNAEHFTTRPHKRALIEAEYERLRRDHLLLARATLGARKQL
jgi:hypothetical protein